MDHIWPRVFVAVGAVLTGVVLSSPVPVWASTAGGQPSDGRIGGVALGEDDVPLTNHDIELTKIMRQGGQEARQVLATASSDAEGRFLFEQLSAGTFRLNLFRDGSVIATSRTLILSNAEMAILDVLVTPPTTVARSLDDMRTRVKLGTRVSVVDAAGNETTGRIADFSAPGLTLVDGSDRRELPADRILRIRRDGDAVWNGLAIGAAVGAGIGFALGTAWCSDSIGRHCLSGKAQTDVTLFMALPGAGIGLLVDWLRPSRELVFQARTAPTVSRLRAVRVAPVVAKRMKGMAFSLAW